MKTYKVMYKFQDSCFWHDKEFTSPLGHDAEAFAKEQKEKGAKQVDLYVKTRTGYHHVKEF